MYLFFTPLEKRQYHMERIFLSWFIALEVLVRPQIFAFTLYYYLGTTRYVAVIVSTTTCTTHYKSSLDSCPCEETL